MRGKVVFLCKYYSTIQRSLQRFTNLFKLFSPAANLFFSAERVVAFSVTSPHHVAYNGIKMLSIVFMFHETTSTGEKCGVELMQSLRYPPLYRQLRIEMIGSVRLAIEFRVSQRSGLKRLCSGCATRKKLSNASRISWSQVSL